MEPNRVARHQGWGLLSRPPAGAFLGPNQVLSLRPKTRLFPRLLLLISVSYALPAAGDLKTDIKGELF